MDEKNPNSLCRICLEDGAMYPIFETDNQENQLYCKLKGCVNEKIEDVEGFPRSICNMCNNTLDTVWNFINKYKESSKILKGGLLKLIKNEKLDTYHDFSDFENDIADVKVKTELEINYEGNDEDTEPLSDLVRPLQRKLSNVTIKKIKKESIIEKNNRKRSKPANKLVKNRTSKIATSMLEGDFSWNGEQWCLNSTKIPTSQPPRKVERKCVTDKDIKKMKIPKNKKPDPAKLCDLCGEVFRNHDRLTAHKKAVHFKNPVKCPKCPRVCVSEYYLNRHIKRKHDANRDFICSVCGQSFAFKGELSSHNKNVHNKHLKPKRTYQCKFCDKTYKCQKSVTIHERSIHTGQRPAECSVCGSSFYHEDYLKEHMRLHTGETPFKCPICGRGYAQRCNMKSHLRIHRVAEIEPAVLNKLRPSYLKLLKDFR